MSNSCKYHSMESASCIKLNSPYHCDSCKDYEPKGKELTYDYLIETVTPVELVYVWNSLYKYADSEFGLIDSDASMIKLLCSELTPDVKEFINDVTDSVRFSCNPYKRILRDYELIHKINKELTLERYLKSQNISLTEWESIIIRYSTSVVSKHNTRVQFPSDTPSSN